MTICPECGKEFSVGSLYCPYCDAKLDAKRKKRIPSEILDLPNLERIPIKNYLVPNLVGLTVIAVIAIVFSCIF